MSTAFNAYEVTGLTIPQRGPVPIETLSSVSVQQIQAKFRTPDGNCVSSSVVKADGQKIDGYVFLTQADVKKFLRSMVQPHQQRIQAEQAILSDLKQRVIDGLEGEG